VLAFVLAGSPQNLFCAFDTTKMSTSLIILAILGSSLVAIPQGAQSQFLKEILLDRCYEHPLRSGSVDGRPETVVSIMSVLEGYHDADIQASSFNSYLQPMDLSSPPDKALFWLYFLGDKEDDLFFLSGKEPPFGLVISERTPGGISRLLWY
jgi:hypothetical protein